ncbi:uncharacterized protein K452DRAFT_317407, partial [Aplosporella prunicola CBS 121167]
MHNYEYKVAEGLQLAAPYDRQVSEAPQPLDEQSRYSTNNNWHEAPQVFNNEPKCLSEPRLSAGALGTPLTQTTTRNDSSEGSPEVLHRCSNIPRDAFNEELRPGGDGQRKRAKICGCSTRLFWIIMGLVLFIVVGGAIGGGVGGSLAAKNKERSNATAETAISTTSTLSSETATAIPHTTTLDRSISSTNPTPTTSSSATGIESFTLALYDGEDYGGATQNVSTTGNYTLPFLADSYVWKPLSSDCCVLFCRDDR